MEEKRTVLVVDDLPCNIEMLNEILQEDYTVRMATSGRNALDAVEADAPDLILLDIMMPDMDGYEVCRKLKADEKTKDIPIIFTTALAEIKNEEKGLNLGAVDYITKPINPTIVKARVRNHLLLKIQQDQLKKSISLMEHEAEILSQKAELGLQAGSLAHDIANLLSPIALVKYLPEYLPEDLPERKEIQEDVDLIMDSYKLCAEICLGFKSYLQDIGSETKVQDVSSLLKPLDMYARSFKGELTMDVADDLPPILCKGYQLKRVFANLFTNASQAFENNRKGKILFRAWCDNGSIFFSIKDNGNGIPKDILPKIFDERFTTKESGTGLGLYLVKQIVDSHGGTIKVESEENSGTAFLLSFPASQEKV